MSLVCIAVILAGIIFIQAKLLKMKNREIKELSGTLKIQQDIAKSVNEQTEKCRAEKEQLRSGSNEEKLAKSLEMLKRQRKKHSENEDEK